LGPTTGSKAQKKKARKEEIQPEEKKIEKRGTKTKNNAATLNHRGEPRGRPTRIR